MKYYPKSPIADRGAFVNAVKVCKSSVQITRVWTLTTIQKKGKSAQISAIRYDYESNINTSKGWMKWVFSEVRLQNSDGSINLNGSLLLMLPANTSIIYQTLRSGAF